MRRKNDGHSTLVPDGSQEAPETLQEAPKMLPRRPKRPQEAPKSIPASPKWRKKGKNFENETGKLFKAMYGGVSKGYGRHIGDTCKHKFLKATSLPVPCSYRFHFFIFFRSFSRCVFFIVFGRLLGRSWAPFWVPRWLQVGPKSLQDGSRNAFFCQKVNLQKNI